MQKSVDCTLPSTTLFVQAGAEMFDTGVETVEPDPLCSWKGHCRRVGAGVGNKSMRSCMVVQELCMPSMIRPERRTYVVVR